MNEQEIATLTNLYVKFQERCKRIAEILSEYDRDFKESKFNNWELDYADCHAVNKFECYTIVDIYAPGWHVDSRALHFPIELVAANDEQIHSYAQGKYNKLEKHE